MQMLKISQQHAIGKSMETNKPKKVEIDSKLVADAAEPIVTKTY